MGLADELQKLEELRQRGTLTEEEFVQAKQSLLSGAGDAMSAHLDEIKYQNELARVDREWEIEREQYLITTRYGQRVVPEPGGAERMRAAMRMVGGPGWAF